MAEAERRNSLTHEDTTDVHTFEEEGDVLTPLPHTSSSSGMGLADRRGVSVEPVAAPKRYGSGHAYKVHPGGDSNIDDAEMQNIRMRTRRSSGSSASGDTPQAMQRRMSMSIKSQDMRGTFMAIQSETVRQHKASVGVDSKWVVYPSSEFRRKWDILSMSMLVYVALFTPFQIAFLGDLWTNDNIGDWWLCFAFDRAVDLVFIIDLGINFRSAWIDDDGHEQFTAREAAARYFYSWFWIDLLSILPYDLISELPGMDAGTGAEVKLPKLMRLFRLIKIAKVIRASRIMKRFEATMTIKYGVLRLAKFAVMVNVIAHWNACGWYLVAGIQSEDAFTWLKATGLYRSEESGVADHYFASLYWAFATLTTIGYGDIAAHTLTERIYGIFSMLISAAVFAYVVGTMVMLVQGLDTMNIEFQQMMDTFNDYMDTKHFPTRLRVRIRKYCLYKRDAHAMSNEAQMLSHVSPALMREVALHIYMANLDKIDCFKNSPRPFLSAVALTMDKKVYGPNEMIMQEGERSTCMFVLTKGRVHIERTVTRQDGTSDVRIVRLVEEGQHFGEESLLFGENRLRSNAARSLIFCEVCTIDKMKLDPIIKLYPGVGRIVRKALIHKLWKTLLRSGRLIRGLRKLARQKAERQAGGAPGSPGPDDAGDDAGDNDDALATAFGRVQAAAVANMDKMQALVTDVIARRQRKRQMASNLEIDIAGLKQENKSLKIEVDALKKQLALRTTR